MLEVSGASALKPDYHHALVEVLYQLADDELVMGHRNSEWLGIAPDIEEDVAFASIAQDEIGHATYFFNLLEKLGEGEADDLAYLRSADERRNAVFVEQENGDWAHSVVRHYLYDVFDHARLQALSSSTYTPLAQGVVKMLREEYYHLLHFETLFTQLATGGGEARIRMEQAWCQLMPSFRALFDMGEIEAVLLEHGILASDMQSVYEISEARLKDVAQQVHLVWDSVWECPTTEPGHRTEHSDALVHLIDTMAEVYRLDPSARW